MGGNATRLTTDAGTLRHRHAGLCGRLWQRSHPLGLWMDFVPAGQRRFPVGGEALRTRSASRQVAMNNNASCNCSNSSGWGRCALTQSINDSWPTCVAAGTWCLASPNYFLCAGGVCYVNVFGRYLANIRIRSTIATACDDHPLRGGKMTGTARALIVINIGAVAALAALTIGALSDAGFGGGSGHHGRSDHAGDGPHDAVPAQASRRGPGTLVGAVCADSTDDSRSQGG